ncbi:MAG: TetR/AcrR family transcriptional regulator [Clostridiaceae bacterium]|nr:TetR/AcrR family transcriptional regulator [Clostridiaceae bacterium]
MAEVRPKSVRERLILAGIREINQYGLQNFSMRRVAAECGVSCAAPYRHFKDRQSYVAAIIEYINLQWSERQQKILETYSGDIREQILEICLDYVKFLLEKPYFRSIIMSKDDEFDSEYEKLRTQLSNTARRLIRRYCADYGIAADAEKRKTYIVRSLIYGAALMFDNGELEYNGLNLEMVRCSIDREFDLP